MFTPKNMRYAQSDRKNTVMDEAKNMNPRKNHPRYRHTPRTKTKNI
jgi:hypothetical protein